VRRSANRAVICLLIMASRVRVPPRSPSNIKSLLELLPRNIKLGSVWERTGLTRICFSAPRIGIPGLHGRPDPGLRKRRARRSRRTDGRGPLAGVTRQLCCTQDLCHGPAPLAVSPDRPLHDLGRPLVRPGFAGYRFGGQSGPAHGRVQRARPRSVLACFDPLVAQFENQSDLFRRAKHLVVDFMTTRARSPRNGRPEREA
jgi:hypothetical protein